jgi:Bacterial protein of unknown function (DUF916)/LytR cell envelope-related transcriptional attenuator
MLRRNNLILVLLTSFSVFLLAAPLVSNAQDSVSFSVSPTIFDMTANPGQQWQSTVRIINANPFELVIYADVVNFVPKGEAGVPRFVSVEENNSDQSTLAQWITTEKKITIPAEQTVELPLKIQVPNDASPGGHYAAVMVSTKPVEGDGNDNNVKTAQVISSLLFLRVTGDISESSSIRSFRTANLILNRPETDFEIRIENKGNVHVQPQGEIKIYNMWGQERGVVPINQFTLFGNVLPQSVRKYSFSWTSEWSVTDIGRYTAVATLAYGIDSRQFMTADTAFWVIPWKILLVFFAFIGGFIAFVSWAIRMYVRRMLLLAGVAPAATAQAVLPKRETSRTKKVTAPLEAGILDLRSRLENTHSISAIIETLSLFIKAYWKFFVAIVGLILFVVLVVWFFKGALAPSREYEVTIEEDGQRVTVAEGETPYQATTPPIAIGKGTSVSLVNRSGSNESVNRVATILTSAGFAVATTTPPVEGLEEKTVVVYNPSVADMAVAVSELLDNALLSAFTSTATSSSSIIVYVGTQAVLSE